jgi:hypothetical protein
VVDIASYNRMKLPLDRLICEDQAEFRKGRSCCDHIFTLRNIIEQALEWNATIYINFLDFEKAFDSLHRETMWKMIKAYGILVKAMNSRNSMMDNNVK